MRGQQLKGGLMTGFYNTDIYRFSGFKPPRNTRKPEDFGVVAFLESADNWRVAS